MTHKRNLFLLAFTFFISLNGFAQNKSQPYVMTCPGEWYTALSGTLITNIMVPTPSRPDIRVNLRTKNIRYREKKTGGYEFCVNVILSTNKTMIVNGEKRDGMYEHYKDDVLLSYSEDEKAYRAGMRFEDTVSKHGMIFDYFLLQFSVTKPEGSGLIFKSELWFKDEKGKIYEFYPSKFSLN